MKTPGPRGRPDTALDGLAERYALSAGQREQLARALAVLEASPHAPTAVRAADQAVDIHLADSLVALELESLRTADRIADLGTGAGFPGLALAVALPEARFNLIESHRRSCQFLEQACSEVEIGNAHVVCERIEAWDEGIGRNDAVLARALAPAPVVLEYAAPLLRMGGVLVDWRGRRDRDEEVLGGEVAQKLGLELAEIRHVTPYAGSRDHHLHLYLKVGDTPPDFPRRTGMARKKPLSSLG